MPQQTQQKIYFEIDIQIPSGVVSYIFQENFSVTTLIPAVQKVPFSRAQKDWLWIGRILAFLDGLFDN